MGRMAFSRATDCGHEFDDFRRDFDLFQIDILHAVFFAERFHDKLGGTITQLDQGVGNTVVAAAGERFGFRQLLGADDLVLEEDCGEFGHGSW